MITNTALLCVEDITVVEWNENIEFILLVDLDFCCKLVFISVVWGRANALTISSEEKCIAFENQLIL